MIEGHNLSVSFGKQNVLQNISLELNAGERIALLGPSGSGKSTLLRLLSGILTSDSGEVLYNGIPPKSSSQIKSQNVRNWVWPAVTLVFQDLRLFPNLTGLDNCLLGVENDLRVVDDINAMAERLKVYHCLKKIPIKMSQGECQRIAIIRALTKRPKFLLLDEPTSALDPAIKNILCNLLNETSMRNGMGILLATHDWEVAKRIADRFVVIRNGKLNSHRTIMEAISSLSGMDDF